MGQGLTKIDAWDVDYVFLHVRQRFACLKKNKAQKFFEKTFATVDDVAKHIYTSITKRKLYIIKQPDAKAVWWLKRHFPNFYRSPLSYEYKHGII